MVKIKNLIILILFSILIGFGTFVSFKCYQLEKENKELKTEQVDVTDSIKVENKVLNDMIIELNKDLDYYKFKVDSLNNVKQQVIIKKEYIVSEDLIEGVVLLKENLRWEQYY